MAGPRVSPALAAAAMLLVVVAAAGSTVHGVIRLNHSIGLDQTSPRPTVQTWIAIVGIVASVVVLVGWTIGTWPEGLKYAVVPLLAVALCSVPLWRRDDTIDVESGGFHRAHYQFDVRDFGIYNGTDQPIRVCLGRNGVCDDDAKGGEQLRSPGLLIGPGDVLDVDWPDKVRGDFNLTITDPVGIGPRHDARLTVEKPPKSSNHDPGYQPPPYQPPPPLPQPPYQPPLR